MTPFLSLLLQGPLKCKWYSAWCCPIVPISFLHFLIFFLLCLGHFIVLSSILPILIFVSFNLLLNPSGVIFQFSYCIFKLCDFSVTFLSLCWCCHSLPIFLLSLVSTFMTTTLNSLSGKWLISISLFFGGGCISCPFIWNIFLCFLILLWSVFVSMH